MHSPMESLEVAVTALASACPGERVEGCEAAHLVEVNRLIGQTRRLLDAAAAQVAAEISRQSRPELGADSLAKKQGHRNANVFLATTLGTTTGDAAKLVQVGAATAPRVLLSGAEAPPRHPHVGAALSRGALGKDAAAAIITLLDGMADRVHPDALDTAEQTLVDQAEGLDLHALQRVLLRAEAYLDPDGLEPKEEDLRAQTALTIRQDRTGLIVLNGKFDPERGAPILTLIDAMVAADLNAQRDDAQRGNGLPPKPVPVMQADALVAICEHYTGCDRTNRTLPGATVIVRVSLADLQAGTGVGLIDGVDQPVCIGTVRRMAAGGGIVPLVLGSDSQILDFGRDKRLFTHAQRLALAERDGGCVGCGAPPGRAKAHHIRWWSRGGPTDLRNGVLLCTSCHHLIHDQGWDIRIDGPGVTAMVWLIPPPWLDPAQTPRPGARRRFDYLPAA